MTDRNLMFFCSFCKEKNDEEIANLQCSIDNTVKFFVRGEHIAFQGSKINHLYLLSHGKIKTEMVSESGLALAVETISAPYPLAAGFLFADNNRFPVDIIALEDSEILLIKKEDIEKQMAKCPSFLRSFMAFNANRMRFLSERLKLFSHRSLKGKIVFYILSKEKHGTFNFDTSISTLADSFRVERPSLSRAISEMVRDKYITFDRGKGRILNYDALQDLLR